MPEKYTLSDEWEQLSDETKEMARQIIRTFADKGLSVCDAKEIFHACEIYMEVNSKITVAD